MNDIVIRKAPPEVVRACKHQALDAGMKLRDWVLMVLQDRLAAKFSFDPYDKSDKEKAQAIYDGLASTEPSPGEGAVTSAPAAAPSDRGSDWDSAYKKIRPRKK